MPSSAPPITPSNFRTSLNSIWRPPPKNHHTPFPRHSSSHLLGLAISGGVDSMALAYLCSRLQWQDSMSSRSGHDEEPRLRFRAFIVDHGFRVGSAEEARKVALEMRKLGIPSTILRLHPHSTTSPWQKLASFETQARKLRYRALGRACRTFRIRSLLCAHHSDDQAETVLIRVLNQKTEVGLQGIKAASVLPECEGIYGVHGSGDVVDDNSMPKYVRLGEERLSFGCVPDDAHLHKEKDGTAMRTAEGGVHLYRPLLGFSKQELISTCEHSRTHWHEDPTNRDVSLTLRNAARRLLESNRLPFALRKPALLKLSEYWRDVSRAREEAAGALFQDLDIRRFDLRSGFVVLNLTSHKPDLDGEDLQIEDVNVATRLIEKISLLVSPKSSIAKHRMTTPVTELFPNLVPYGHERLKLIGESEAHITNLVNLSCGGVQWLESMPTTGMTAQSVRQYILSRQPIPTATIPIRRWASLPGRCGELSHLGEPGSDGSHPYWTWQLWDGRFWLRVSHRTAEKIIARPLVPGDMMALRKSISNKHVRENLDGLLEAIAPGNVRFTLPVLAEDIDGPALALPTLDIAISTMGPFLAWQVLYKKTELPWTRRATP